jgi:hypothetical protein
LWDLKRFGLFWLVADLLFLVGWLIFPFLIGWLVFFILPLSVGILFTCQLSILFIMG